MYRVGLTFPLVVFLLHAGTARALTMEDIIDNPAAADDLKGYPFLDAILATAAVATHGSSYDSFRIFSLDDMKESLSCILPMERQQEFLVDPIPDVIDSAIGAADVQLGRVLETVEHTSICLLYTSPSPRDQRGSRMPSSA